MSQILIIGFSAASTFMTGLASAATLSDEALEFLRTNEFGGERIKQQLLEFKIDQPDVVAEYLNDPRYERNALRALDVLRTKEPRLTRDTTEKIKRAMTNTTDKINIEPFALLVVLRATEPEEAIEFIGETLPITGRRSVLKLVEWIGEHWDNVLSRDLEMGNELVASVLERFRVVFCETRISVHIGPNLDSLLNRPPFNQPPHEAKARKLCLSLLADMARINTYSHKALLRYLLDPARTSRSEIEDHLVEITAGGLPQRTKAIVWTLEVKHPTNEMAQRVVARVSDKLDWVARFASESRTGKISEFDGMVWPIAELSWAWKKESER